ncbi:Uncharacterised protein [Enterobacter hormaechei]|nr:hypothetical protein EDF79_3067 [Raoultella terrigena]CZV17406.1 Uncharacterised protein [Enterobacter asburiae]CZW61086.1 Uncharacterised protein [Enterobacter hormaechei]CZX54552.1 Uncharacterised protein [Enterobacter hormaechei]CZX82522.1 Uncharacterised protein [Enterobacter hormaechei]
MIKMCAPLREQLNDLIEATQFCQPSRSNIGK